MKAPGQLQVLAVGYAIDVMDITAHDARHLNLLLLIEEYGSIQKLADALGRSHSQISQLRNKTVHSTSGKPRNIGDDLAREIEAQLGKSPGWLDSLHLAQNTPPYLGSVEEQQLSLSRKTIPPTTITWEEAMDPTTDLPAVFELRLVDDAMTPRAGQGTTVKFATSSAAKPGQAVLVRTSDHVLYFREYRVIAPGRWQAAPTNGAYPSFDSKRDGLTIVAVFVGIEADWSQLVR